jgi:serine/threonine protein kinase
MNSQHYRPADWGTCEDLQDASKLYMAMEVCPHGDLFEQLEARKPLSLENVRFYAAEMVLILQYLRDNKIVFRCAVLYACKGTAYFGAQLRSDIVKSYQNM